MRYYKTVDIDFIVSVGTGSGGEEITEQEYAAILTIIRSRPTVREGFNYRLKTDLTWEEYAMPPVEPEPYEPTSEDKAEAYDILIGGAE